MHHRVAYALAAAAGLLMAACQSTVGLQPGQEPPHVASTANRTALLQQAVAHSGRTPANVARDRYRHPVETLDFFEVDPNDTVVEVWPGGGWYTEILAPYLAAGGGKLYVVAPEWGRSGIDKLNKPIRHCTARSKSPTSRRSIQIRSGTPTGAPTSC